MQCHPRGQNAARGAWHGSDRIRRDQQRPRLHGVVHRLRRNLRSRTCATWLARSDVVFAARSARDPHTLRCEADPADALAVRARAAGPLHGTDHGVAGGLRDADPRSRRPLGHRMGAAGRAQRRRLRSDRPRRRLLPTRASSARRCSTKARPARSSARAATRIAAAICPRAARRSRCISTAACSRCTATTNPRAADASSRSRASPASTATSARSPRARKRARAARHP